MFVFDYVAGGGDSELEYAVATDAGDPDGALYAVARDGKAGEILEDGSFWQCPCRLANKTGFSVWANDSWHGEHTGAYLLSEDAYDAILGGDLLELASGEIVDGSSVSDPWEIATDRYVGMGQRYIGIGFFCDEEPMSMEFAGEPPLYVYLVVGD